MTTFAFAWQAMHLVYRCLEGEPAPTQLNPSLIPPSKRGRHFAGASTGMSDSETDDATAADGDKPEPQAAQQQQQPKEQQSQQPGPSEGEGVDGDEEFGTTDEEESVRPSKETLAKAANAVWAVSSKEQKTYMPFFKVSAVEATAAVFARCLLGVCSVCLSDVTELLFAVPHTSSHWCWLILTGGRQGQGWDCHRQGGPRHFPHVETAQDRLGARLVRRLRVCMCVCARASVSVTL